MEHLPSSEGDYVGDAEILRLLEASRLAFEAGDKSELMTCVLRCATFQAVIPEWAADALLALQENMACGRVADFNAAFGKPSERKNTRAARARLAKVKPHVLAEIQLLRANGTSFNDDEMFSQVVENLQNKGFNINHRDVQMIYKSDGKFLKEVPRGPHIDGNHGFVLMALPRPRRRGRNILRDN